MTHPLARPAPVAPLAPGARVQRPTNEFPVLHLEIQVPAGPWDVVVDGAVANPMTWSLDAVRAMVTERRVWDLNCVWGWTKLACNWDGVPAGRLIEAAQPLPGARWVMATAAGGAYGSCFSLPRARRSLLAWRLDGEDLSPEHGGPLRLVPPPTKWAFKGVKWVSRLTVLEEFEPGFWEGIIGDPHGDIPWEVLHHTEEASLAPNLPHLPRAPGGPS